MTNESCRSFAGELMSGPFQGPFLMGAYTLTCGASIFACWKLTGLIIFPKLGIPMLVAGFVIVPAGLILLTMVFLEEKEFGRPCWRPAFCTLLVLLLNYPAAIYFAYMGLRGLANDFAD